MSTLTIRGLQKETIAMLKRKAKATGVSMNRLLIQMLEGSRQGGAYKPREYHDLDDLFGSLSKKDAAALERNISTHRKIDKELWK